MKFKLVEKIELLETQTPEQRKENWFLKSQFFGDKANEYTVHHLNDNKTIDNPKIKSSDLDNILFLRKTDQKDANALHQFITAAANMGSAKKLFDFLKEQNIIMQPYTDEAGNPRMKSISLDEAVKATIKGRTNPPKNTMQSVEPEQLKIDFKN